MDPVAEHWAKRVKKAVDGKTHMKSYGVKRKIRTLGWNADGRRLASGSTDGYVRIYSTTAIDLGADAGSELRGHSGDVDQIAWHPTHTDLLASTGNDKTVRLWDLRKPSAAQMVETKAANINMSWHPAGLTVGVGDHNDVITFIDIRGRSDADSVARIANKLERPEAGETNEFAWNYAGNLLYIAKGADLRGNVEILHYPTLDKSETIDAHTASCYCIDFDPKGRYWATGSADSLIALWDIEESICIRTFARGDEAVQSIGFSHDGELLAAASPERPIYIMHVETGQYVGHVDTFGGSTNTVAWHPTKHWLAYAAVKADGAIHLLQIPNV
ncbi:hypothetical protein SeMB42_g00668 [Synchytrium endobioticum]|uniref:Uncharacterized protein n=1 Tax=Synchytrium endobioticum TaxID=286115 RepID=A0A507DI26_9FUNG|nr:hypothetical protein SeLEV6574_g00827 [Synchytrium endobioticum]TPX53604.1 hypothetical protein SeMB42_g00668 [Synchytrium endobioticum]